MNEPRHYRMRPWIMLGVAAGVAAMALGGLFLGEFGAADSGGGSGTRRAVSSAFDLLALPAQKLIAYGFLVALLLLALFIAFQALRPAPALTIDADGVTQRALFGTKTIAWRDIERAYEQSPGVYALAGRGKLVTVATNMLVAPEGEIIAVIRAALARR